MQRIHLCRGYNITPGWHTHHTHTHMHETYLCWPPCNEARSVLSSSLNEGEWGWGGGEVCPLWWQQEMWTDVGHWIMHTLVIKNLICIIRRWSNLSHLHRLITCNVRIHIGSFLSQGKTRAWQQWPILWLWKVHLSLTHKLQNRDSHTWYQREARNYQWKFFLLILQRYTCVSSLWKKKGQH